MPTQPCLIHFSDPWAPNAQELQLAGSCALSAVSRRLQPDEIPKLGPLLKAMKTRLKYECGQGISVPQLGENVQLFMLSPSKAGARHTVVINPRIRRSSVAKAVDWEACLSVPGYGALVARPRSVEVDFKTLTGERISRTLTGQRARCFQHELVRLTLWSELPHCHRFFRKQKLRCK